MDLQGPLTPEVPSHGASGALTFEDRTQSSPVPQVHSRLWSLSHGTCEVVTGVPLPHNLKSTEDGFWLHLLLPPHLPHPQATGEEGDGEPRARKTETQILPLPLPGSVSWDNFLHLPEPAPRKRGLPGLCSQ